MNLLKRRGGFKAKIRTTLSPEMYNHGSGKAEAEGTGTQFCSVSLCLSVVLVLLGIEPRSFHVLHP